MPKKILAITYQYPPYHKGGYQLRLRDIFDELSCRGHKILVITSKNEWKSELSYQLPQYKIIRKLHRRTKARHFVKEVLFDLVDTALLDCQINHFQPDVIYLGHIMPLSKAIMPYLAFCETTIVYDEGGMGLIGSWENRGRWFYFIEKYVSRYSILNKIKPLVINMVCKFSGNRIKSQWAWPYHMQIIFNSEFNLNNTMAKGVPINSGKVIHSGLDIEKFCFVMKTKPGSPLLLILPGRITPQKGQLDAVRLLAKLQDSGIDGNLILVGENYTHSYYSEIENEIKRYHLENKITIMPMVSQGQLIDLYHKADICFFPSYQIIGYSRVPLEAMACGCVVISYGNEGSDELIRDKQTGFLVAPEDYQGITNLIKELICDSKLIIEMICNARKEVEDNCSLRQYVDKIEDILITAAGDQ